jgi:hypothetical protein
MIFVIVHGETSRAKERIFSLHNCTIAKEYRSNYEGPASGNDIPGLNQIIRARLGCRYGFSFSS